MQNQDCFLTLLSQLFAQVKNCFRAKKNPFKRPSSVKEPVASEFFLDIKESLNTAVLYNIHIHITYTL